MPVYNFKTIVKVPGSKDLIDVILSKTQRKTPTVCHKGWYIQRIRQFYARKIKFTSESFAEKLTTMLNDFPRLDDIHPYYADLINVLYSKHHYKLALGEISKARTLIENIAKDSLRYIKFGETQYRCKSLKRAALGRMATVARKLNTSLGYLERVRQHLSRLPSIDPTARTIMITGFPNVGKSSFINKVSRAEVDVQNYAFTTKSIFVGHFDYKNLRWQVVDTPGILDHSLEDRNIIEMQAITALAHLNSTILFFIDISEECGYTIKKQVSLYHSIKALFANKPLLVVANKTDLKPFESLDGEDKALIEAVAADRHTEIVPMSNISEEGITKVKSTACEMLLRQRCERRLQTAKVNQIANRINIATPTARDTKDRGVSIPAAVLARREKEEAAQKLLAEALRDEGMQDEDAIAAAALKQVREAREKHLTLRDLEVEAGGIGRFNFDRRTYFDLANSEHRFDTIPEIMDGKNIADFYDADIEARLDELEREEEELAEAFAQSGIELEGDSDELTEEQFIVLEKIRAKKAMLKDESRMKAGQGVRRSAVLPRHLTGQSLKKAEERLTEIGLDVEKFITAVKVGEANTSRGRKREREREARDNYTGESAEDEAAAGAVHGAGMSDGEDGDESDTRADGRSKSVARSISRMREHPSHARSQSRMRGEAPLPGEGFRDKAHKMAAEARDKQTWKRQAKFARASESDRHVFDEKPKHLFSGKRGMGSTDRR